MDVDLSCLKMFESNAMQVTGFWGTPPIDVHYHCMKNIQSSSLSMDSNLAFFQVSELLQFTQIHGKSGIPVIFFRAD